MKSVSNEGMSGLDKLMVFQMLLLFQVPDHHLSLWHKLGPIAYKSDTSQFGINGVAQLPGHLLFE